MTRGNARELALHLIYGREFTGEQPEETAAIRLEEDYFGKLASESNVYSDRPSAAQLKYIDTVTVGVANRTEELNAAIQKYSIGWDITRISRITRCILQLAVFEMNYIDDVPTGVAISEAVRLTKIYDSEDAAAFVNGILGTMSRSRDSSSAEEQS